MEVTVLRATERPERLVCQCARGDYYDGYVGDTGYYELMEGVDYDEDDVPLDNEHTRNAVLDAKTKSFCEKQLARGHYGPWEHPQITFAVEGVSRVTMAQITRHRHMTFDVQSQRYVDFSETEAVVPATLLSREKRIEEYPHVYDESGEHFNRDEGRFDMGEDEVEHWRKAYKQFTAEMLDYYEMMVEQGIPKEDARFVLPLGTPVNMTFSGNARTFLHLLNLRSKASAQWEIRALSDRLLDELFDWMPYTFSWYSEYKPHKIGP